MVRFGENMASAEPIMGAWGFAPRGVQGQTVRESGGKAPLKLKAFSPSYDKKRDKFAPFLVILGK